MEELDRGGDVTYSERPIKILHTAECMTHNKVIKTCKVQWSVIPGFYTKTKYSSYA
jgi:hypothetical protein